MLTILSRRDVRHPGLVVLVGRHVLHLHSLDYPGQLGGGGGGGEHLLLPQLPVGGDVGGRGEEGGGEGGGLGVCEERRRGVTQGEDRLLGCDQWLELDRRGLCPGWEGRSGPSFCHLASPGPGTAPPGPAQFAGLFLVNHRSVSV